MKIGTRKSRLAVIQAELVMSAIREHFPMLDVELTGLDTKGDRQLNRSLSDFGGKGAFTREIERAMLEGSIDLAVHSAKDLPLDLPEELCIGAVLKREDSRDVWISCHYARMKDCPDKTIVGTGSRRRALQAAEINPGLEAGDIRGNVQTRLKKLSDGHYDGIILAAAGLKRLGYLTDEDRGYFVLEGIRYYYEYLPDNRFLPAAGQGIIAVEARQNDCREILEAIHDEESWLMFTAERAFLGEIGGGCNEAAAISVRQSGRKLLIKARYAGNSDRMATVDEEITLTEWIDRNRQIAADAGKRAAKSLLKRRE